MFREFYYWAYTYYSKRKRFKGEEADYTYWLISSLIGFNLLILWFIIDHLCIVFFQYSFMAFLIKGKSFKDFLFAGILMLPAFLYTYFQLYRKKKEILQYYKNKKMSQFRQDWGKLFFWLYAILSVISVVVAALIFRKMESGVEM